MDGRIRLGISSCLLGQMVRFDGGHKLDHFLKDTLGSFVDFVPVCPEFELGLGVPREALRLYDAYQALFLEALGIRATARMNANVLTHIAGYFKKSLSADEKAELVATIEAYRTELVPLIVPITLLNHYVRKYDEPYLKRQFYLRPHPMELRLRNHV